jgi:hydroxyquinol 1,2-dioxygenase
LVCVGREKCRCRFAGDVRLTTDEYLFAMNYLLQLSGYCKGGRQEFLGLAAMLGLETVVIQISQPKPEGATLPGVLGPLFVPNAPSFANGADIAAGVAGEPLYVSGRILAIDRRPIPNATINVWQSDGDGLYDVQGDLATDGMRGGGN